MSITTLSLTAVFDRIFCTRIPFFDTDSQNYCSNPAPLRISPPANRVSPLSCRPNGASFIGMDSKNLNLDVRPS